MFCATKRIARQGKGGSRAKSATARKGSDVCSLSVLQADAQLAVGFVDGVNRVHAMAAKIVRRVLKVVLGIVKCAQRIFDLWVSPGRG